MKRLPGLFIALVIVVGCASAAVAPSPISNSSASSSTTSTPGVVTSTSLPTVTTSTVVPPGPPVAWVASSGVPVAVTGVNGETIEILTPCGNSALLTEGRPLYEVDVVIDPGHGGPVDTGAVAPTGLAEKDINLQVSEAVHELLTERGIPAMLTRTGDYPIPIGTRSAYSDIVGAKALVSIHHNSPQAPASDIPGVEIFVRNQTPESARLGGLMYAASMETLGRFDVEWSRSADAGVMTVLNNEGGDAYGMVRLPEAPAALVELGYIANRAEAELYADPAYAPAMATSIADAIEAFLTTEDTGAPLVEGRVFNPERGVGSDQCVEPDLELSLYPDVVEATVSGNGTAYNFIVTVSSPYDSPQRYADAWRVIGDDGKIYGVLEVAHDHAAEQPFTRTLTGIEIPDTVEAVTIEGRDQVYGWGGGTVEVSLP